MSFPRTHNRWLEDHALFKQPKEGKCPNSTFAMGIHRIGYMPKTCPNDGVLKGMSCQQVCLDCGKEFNHSIFVVGD